ncbi:hypothetical protein [Candidatus Protochlamydia phocaeensis]|uniref:hypothetical protein n=1 Tax=Candidatus Protochlamydia phocaeensis TaxID=1414722 RepID=UPI00083856FC|nr:hypothetical protein [Candidatus Protochlamydia phocaeensis]
MRLNKWIGLFLLLLGSWICTVEANEPPPSPIHYRVSRIDYTFSSVFDMVKDKQPMGNVVKSVFHIATHYDAYDRFGLYEGQGVCRILCLGLFYAWGTEIDIYDAHDRKIGFIDGQVATAEPAKFSFYNAAGERVAIAYLDQNCMGFSVVDPNNTSFVLARLTRNFIPGFPDTWDVVLYYPDLLPPCFVKIFAAFACDSQNRFRADL